MSKIPSRTIRPFVLAPLLGAFVGVVAGGCQPHRMGASLLPSFAAAQQERAIADHALQSEFPSPSDVGLSNDEDE